MKEMIQNKITGKEIVAAKYDGPDNIINLIEALTQSVNALQTPKRKRKSG